MNDAISPAVRERIAQAFTGFIGNDEAVYGIKRILAVALMHQPPTLRRVMLLTGAPSTGKTEVARRMAACLALPMAQMDGRNVRSREALAEFLSDALSGQAAKIERAGERGGLPVRSYPPMIAFVDEAHMISADVQQTLLTLMESNDRTAVLKGADSNKFVMDASHIGFVFATTKPSEIDAALRSRFTEITLQRYTEDQVVAMLEPRYGTRLAGETLLRIARVARLTPRIAFDVAQDVIDEVMTAETVVEARVALRQVMRERGIVTENGLTRTDIRYLRSLAKEAKPVSGGTVRALLYDVPPDTIEDDTEPFLISRGLVRIRERGRVLTMTGHAVVDQLETRGI